jgi:peptidoglycan hydrolase-like protein with peptidoglycan-binding domain
MPRLRIVYDTNGRQFPKTHFTAPQSKPPTTADIYLRSGTGQNGGAATLSAILARYPLTARQLLPGWQRQYGNRYIQRALALARQPAGPDANNSGNRTENETPAPSGGCTTQPPAKDKRAIFDNLCLVSDQLKDDPRLNDAFHNNPPLTSADSGENGPVAKFQQALLDAGEKLPKSGVDGKWGNETSSAVASLQTKHGMPAGGFEAGRNTLLALDTELQKQKPAPAPPPQQNATLVAQCATGQQADQVIVSGTGFPPGAVNLLVDGAGGNSAIADASGAVAGSVPAKLKDGSHVVEATAGAVHGFAQFTTPCAPQPTPVDPNLVTQNELLVLIKYQFLGQKERDAVEDAIKDLKGNLDPTPVSWGKALAETIGLAITQFVYGAFEQVILTAIKKTVTEAQRDIVNQASDKASDSLEDGGKDGFKTAIDKEDQAPTRALEEQVESFRRAHLASLAKGYFTLKTEWIQKVKADQTTANITPPELQGLATSLDQTAEAVYQNRYNFVLQAWDSYIASASKKLGGTTQVVPVDGRPPEIFYITNLSTVDNKDPKDVPGVLLIGLRGPGGSDELPSAADEGPGFESVHMDHNDVHIFGMSETTRKNLAASHPQLAALHMPIVFRGEPKTGGFVAIGKNEKGDVVDAGSDAKGKEWLIAVGQTKRFDPSLSDPNLGAEAVFKDDLDADEVDNIKGP